MPEYNNENLLELLDYIDPESLTYSEWTGIGMALKEAGYHASDWDAWSRRDTKRYHPGECEKKWRTFTGTGITAGTLVKMALDNGYTPQKEDHALDWEDTINRRDDFVVVDRNWIEACDIQEPLQWEPAKELIRYLETLFDSTDTVGYTIDDNPFLDPVFVDALKREYAGTVYYNRFILGEWAAAEGVIYRDFANSVSAGGDRRFQWGGDPPRLIEVAIGVDFGGSGSKHAFVATGMLPGYAGAVVLASRRIEPDTPQALERAFVDFCLTVFSGYGRIDHIYCDSAEQVLIRGMQHALRASPLPWAASHMANAAKIEITDRIRLVSSLMGAGRFWYMPAAASVQDALATALWNSKNPTKDERLDDGSTDIDTLDALEYSLERNYKRFLKARNCTA